jgi:Na+-transporting NADH:ubiquinone oxidoreductase subunit F
MTYNADPLSNPFVQLDYSLTGANSKLAIEKGLAEAEWYQCPVLREVMGPARTGPN